MCRLFFSFHNKHVKSLLEEFLAQSIHKTKYTPYLNNYRGHVINTDGFGIAWKQTEDHDWNIYKQPKVYTEYEGLDDIINSIQGDDIVIAHIRKKTYGNASLENTHPFYYDKQVFVQNGKIDSFYKHVSTLDQYMHKSLFSKIRGQTDTEYLFFLFISCKKYLQLKSRELVRNISKNSTRKKRGNKMEFSETQIELYEKIINNTSLFEIKTKEYYYNINAFYILVGIFREHSIELLANIIYANNTVVLMSRYIYYDQTKYEEKKSPKSLYWNKCRSCSDNGILISSEPLSNYNASLIEENSLALFDYKKNKLIESQI